MRFKYFEFIQKMGRNYLELYLTIKMEKINLEKKKLKILKRKKKKILKMAK